MDKEIELKFEISNIRDVSFRLESTGYKLTSPRTYELSVMYDNPEGLMQKTDGRVRVRQSGNRVEFAYKKPITRQGIKQEIEYEVEVSKLEPLKKILEAMEFSMTTSYERYRTEYKKDDIKVTIDEYPFAKFIEIEGDEHQIVKEAQKLSFDKDKNLTDSCDTLFMKWRIANGLKPTAHMRFDDYQR